ncbi:MAG: hypothetical protein H6673_10065 [Anaerolineales bacterium]|nr:hypothetical protein [Anaerolineales bacterium]
MKKSGLADSPFFQDATQGGHEVYTRSAPARKSEPTEVRTENRSEKRPVLPTRRLARRYSFEFYDDQIQTLKRLKFEAESQGQRLTLSDLVREALDQYLQRFK